MPGPILHATFRTHARSPAPSVKRANWLSSRAAIDAYHSAARRRRWEIKAKQRARKERQRAANDSRRTIWVCCSSARVADEATETTRMTAAVEASSFPQKSSQFGLVPGEEQAVRAWLTEQGFADGDLRSDAKIDGYWMMTPLMRACEKGQVNVCRWLHDHGEAAADITKVDRDGWTPMFVACWEGHLSVCKWLFDAGTASDIVAADIYGQTPMYMACKHDHLPVCKWLVLNGALNRTATAAAAAAAAAAADDDDKGHVAHAIVLRDTRGGRHHRSALLNWARRVVAVHRVFQHVVLRASVILPESQCHAAPHQRCHLPRLPRCVLELLSKFLDVKMGRQLRNAREFAEALLAIGAVATAEAYKEEL